MTTKRKAWTDSENAKLSRVYFDMLAAATSGNPYNKAKIIRGVQANGLDRSRGSIEAKLMNCTAVHKMINPQAVTMDGFGYRSLDNYQAALVDAFRNELTARYDMWKEEGTIQQRARAA